MNLEAMLNCPRKRSWVNHAGRKLASHFTIALSGTSIYGPPISAIESCSRGRDRQGAAEARLQLR